MALAIEMNNRMKRKAAAMGVFLNVETQRKFLKIASNAELTGSFIIFGNMAEDALEERDALRETKSRVGAQIGHVL